MCASIWYTYNKAFTHTRLSKRKSASVVNRHPGKYPTVGYFPLTRGRSSRDLMAKTTEVANRRAGVPPDDDDYLQWCRTRPVRETARGYEIPIFEIPRKPPTIPVAYPDETAPEGYTWLFPGTYISEPGVSSPFDINSRLRQAHYAGRKVILMTGEDEKGTRFTQIYAERNGEATAYMEANYARWLEDRAYYYRYYGVPEGHTDQDEDPWRRLNPIPFTKRILPHQRIPGADAGGWKPNFTKGGGGSDSGSRRVSRVARVPTMGVEKTPKPPKPPKAPKAPKASKDPLGLGLTKVKKLNF